MLRDYAIMLSVNDVTALRFYDDVSELDDMIEEAEARRWFVSKMPAEPTTLNAAPAVSCVSYHRTTGEHHEHPHDYDV